MNLINESLIFSAENIKKIEDLKYAKFVCDTTYKGTPVSVFYGDTVHPVSNSRYFGLYYDASNKLMITDGAFVEQQEITGVVAENGDVVFSRHRHDYNTSPDGTVFVDGGREYIRTNTTNQVTLLIRDGAMRILEDI